MTPFGVYVHVPFCSAKCDYCAFATWTDRSHLVERYLASVRSEIDRAVRSGLPVATSVFVGGGTPSLVPPELLIDVIAAIPTADGAEITVECNPDDTTEHLAAVLADGGVTRVSLGVQSASAHVLRALGRQHDPDHVSVAVAALRAAGIPSFNLDLIYGVAGESLDDWSTTLDVVLAMEPPHVSAYGLTVEPGTPLAADPARHPDDDDQADKYELADERLAAAGLRNYEVSNWSRPGEESRHNQLYWEQGNYLGVGCAAHSHRDGRRWWNVRTPERYIDLIDRGEPVEAASETLDDATRRFERLQLGLRTARGVEAAAFDERSLEQLAGLIEEHPGHADRVVLTRSGRLLANEVAARLSDGPAGSFEPVDRVGQVAPDLAHDVVVAGVESASVRRR